MADGDGGALRKPPQKRSEPEQRDTGPKKLVEAALQPTRARRRPKKRSMRMVLLLLGPLVVIVGGIYVYLTGGRYVGTDNAYVQADKLTITTDVSGVVASIEVKEGQQVKAGDVLFKLDEEPFRIALNGAQAQLAVVGADLAAQQANYREKLADIQKAKADLEFYSREFDRQSSLAGRGIASQAALDSARRNRDAARQSIDALQQQAAALLAQLGGAPDLPLDQQARYQQAQAAVDAAQRNLRRTVVVAPITGIVTNVSKLQIGQYLPAAQGAFNLVASEQVWIDANPKETDLTYVKVGDKAVVTVDSYPGRQFDASVCSISPATGAEFSLLPAQNSSGNWVKVVQRIPIRVCVTQPQDGPRLRAGMSAVVEIDTGHTRHFRDLFDWF
jgi:membrane fusion protein (multidrug efflux system)